MNDNRQSAAKQVPSLRAIPGFPEYLISESGEIWSTKTNKYLKQSTNKDGYKQISLRGGGKSHTYRVHRLTALAHMDNPDGLSDINHKDFNKTNNNISNLEWCSHDDNMLHATIGGRFKGDKPLRKVFIFTNVFNGKSFAVIGLKNAAKHFRVPVDSLKALRTNANTGKYIKSGILSGLRIDIQNLKVQRLSQNESTDECPEVGSPL